MVAEVALELSLEKEGDGSVWELYPTSTNSLGQLRAPPQHPGFTQAPLPLIAPVPTHAIPLELIKPLISRLEIWLRNATLEQAGNAAIVITAISMFKEAEDKLMSGLVFNTGNSCPGHFWSPCTQARTEKRCGR